MKKYVKDSKWQQKAYVMIYSPLHIQRETTDVIFINLFDAFNTIAKIYNLNIIFRIWSLGMLGG